jgi:dolichyl-phosphate beta-glucosyltransferase
MAPARPASLLSAASRLPAYVSLETLQPESSPAPTVSVVIPAYEEADRITPYLREVFEHFERLGEPYEVLVVDDGSRDRTSELVRGLMQVWPVLRLVRYADNRGKGHAVRMGMLAARGAFRLMTDADGSTPIAEIARLRARMPAREPAVVIGSRALPAADVRRDVRLHRWAIGEVFSALRRAVLGVRLRDTQCGFKLVSAAAAEALFGAARLDGFAFDVEVLFLAARAGIPVVEVAVNWHDAGSSRVRFLSDPWRMARDVWRVRSLHARTVVAPGPHAPDRAPTRR